MTIQKTIAKAGRSYKVNENGATDVSQKYQLTLDSPLTISELPTSFTGVPAIGSAHPNRPGFYALYYEVTQPEGNAKHTLDVVVNYGPADITIDPLEPTNIDQVTEWGWDDGTGEKELVNSVGANPKPVVNSAGDPFESVPTVSVPAPVFTKVIRTTTRKSYAQYLCTVNDAALTIGAMSCPIGTLLCTVAERKLIGEEKYPYEYTIHLKYRSNKILDNNNNLKEIGWDVAIVDAGMRAINTTTQMLELIELPMGKSGELATVTSPALLDGSGHARDITMSNYKPVILEFQAYERTSFPNWFYSEPPTPGVSVTPPSNTNTNTTP